MTRTRARTRSSRTCALDVLRGPPSGTGTRPPEMPALLIQDVEQIPAARSRRRPRSQRRRVARRARRNVRAELARAAARPRAGSRAPIHTSWPSADQPPRCLVAEPLVGSGDQVVVMGSRVAKVPAGHQRTLSATLAHPDMDRRARRTACAPGATGWPGRGRPAATRRRRAPGLRREEVGEAARGLSVDYLARLEQGRAQRTRRRRVLGAAGPCAAAERGRARAPVPRRGPDGAGCGRSTAHLTPSVRRVLDRLDDVPVLVTTRRGDRSPPTRSRGSCSARSTGNIAAAPLLAASAARDRPRRPRTDRRGRRGRGADLHDAAGRYPNDEPLRELIADLREREPGVRRALEAAADRPRTRRPQDDHPPRGGPDHRRLRRSSPSPGATCG